MRLSQFSDYSLRLLLYLAERPGAPNAVGDAAAWYGVSKDHLVKVAHNLVKLGYVRSVRGRNGGLQLARPAAEIGIAAVVRDTERDFNIVECFSAATNTCHITRSCALKHVLRRARKAFFDVLEDQTLESIVQPTIRTPQRRAS
jgi:Rrf2 family nitric oxide-sensitive transcriptional repressor